MNQYAEFDRVLLAEIVAGNNNLTALEHSEALRKAIPTVALGKPYFRTIDARLQALRKAGSIVYQSKRWSVS